MKFTKASKYHDESDCGRYIIATARTSDTAMAVYAVRRFRGSHAIGIERGIGINDAAGYTEAKERMRALCAKDAETVGAEL